MLFFRAHFLFLSILSFAYMPQLSAKGITQSVSPEMAALTVTAGSEFLLPLKYSATDESTTGIGIALLFDTSKLEFTGFKNVLEKGFLTSDNLARKVSSSEEFMSRVTIAWASVGGEWPGVEELPVALATASFRLLQGTTADTSIIIQGMPMANATFETVPVKISVSKEGGGGVTYGFLVLLLLLMFMRQSNKAFLKRFLKWYG